MSNPRKVPTNGFPYGVFEDPRNPLILVEEGYPLQYAKIIDDKKNLLAQYRETTLSQVFLVWQGKASSDVFELTSEYVEKLLNP